MSIASLITFVTLVSSAKMLTMLSVTLSGRSFIMTRNSKGQSTVPWGIPDVTLASDDLAPFAKITCCLSLRKL